MKISVNKYTLDPQTVNGGTAGSHGLEALEFDFSPEWNEFSRTVTFFPPKSVAKCVSFTGSSLPIPAEVTARAGKTAFVLCGAKDGYAVITLTGVIEVSPTLQPTLSDTEEHTPGALETATLLCAEARADARSAAASAEAAAHSAKTAGDTTQAVLGMAQEVQNARNVVSDLYDDVLEGTAVYDSITESNRLDRSHAVSVAGLTERLDHLLSIISPFRIRAVDALPVSPDTDCIYLYDGKAMVYGDFPRIITLYKWGTRYYNGSGPACILSYTRNIQPGTMLYWATDFNISEEAELYEYAVVETAGEHYITQYGEVELIDKGAMTVTGTQSGIGWGELHPQYDLTPYLQQSPACRLITGGAA